MVTDQPSGRDPSGGDDHDQHHRDRSPEQGHQHSPGHDNRPGQARAPAETRSRPEYAADVRGAGWRDQPASPEPGRPHNTPARPDSGTGRDSSHRAAGSEQSSDEPSSHSQKQPGDRGTTQHGTTGDVERTDHDDRPGTERAPQRDQPPAASPGPAADSGLTSPQNQTHPQDTRTNEGIDGPAGYQASADAEESDGHQGAGDAAGIHAPGRNDDEAWSEDVGSYSSPAADGTGDEAPGAVQADRHQVRGQLEHADGGRAPETPDPQQPEALPKAEKITVDGKVIEVTHNRADGIWVEGLPGEIPHRIGDVLASPHEDKRARGDRFFRKAVENADDLLDSAEKNINLGHDALQRPPTHTEIPVSVPSSGHEVPHHEIDAGSVATAGLTVGVLCWAAGEWISRKMKGLDDAGHR